MREGSDVMAGAASRLVPVNFWGLEWGRGGRESGLSSPMLFKEKGGGDGRGVYVC